jgi:hypothetical protein
MVALFEIVVTRPWTIQSRIVRLLFVRFLGNAWDLVARTGDTGVVPGVCNEGANRIIFGLHILISAHSVSELRMGVDSRESRFDRQ